MGVAPVAPAAALGMTALMGVDIATCGKDGALADKDYEKASRGSSLVLEANWFPRCTGVLSRYMPHIGIGQ